MKYVQVPLHPDAYYSYAISLEGVSYTVRFKYVTRTLSWYMDLFTRDNEPVLVGIKLVPDHPLTFDYVNPYSGMFRLFPKTEVDDRKIAQYPEQIHKYYDFYYFYEE